ncbi:DUF4365 domain-containing protein [Nafulsella turpanensis]|uniref:DUF4365 domain-containing protein n=1 Tax=Nafulsella turpanensis TaxID=1265690 RepID=UPI000346E727|nr:DUF4365 domain-containing protein [Nafulsella turpanensis]
MRSKLDTYSLNEEDSRAIISKYCRMNNWKYRKMEWDNDIDGEIEIFNEERETTAKFIKVQLKTINDPAKFEGLDSHVSYDAPVKFLNFCDVCEIPIILVVFNIQKEIGYFLFIQKYICEELDVKNPNWRNNSTTLRLQIPLIDSFENAFSRAKLIEIAYSGTKLISQLRKIETYKNYYTVIRQGDNSHGTALRTDIRILVEKSFASSREAMRILIPKIHEQYSKKVYHRNQWISQRFKNKSYDVIYLFFYDSIEDSNYGQSFCSTLWVDANLPEIGRPLVSDPNEKVEDINIYWNSTANQYDFIRKNLLDKGEYLPFIDKVFIHFEELYSKVLKFSQDYKEEKLKIPDYIQKIKTLSLDLDSLNGSIRDLGFPPNECKDLNTKINSLIAYLHNIRIVVSDNDRDFRNILNCIQMYLRYIEEELPDFRYERKKVR